MHFLYIKRLTSIKRVIYCKYNTAGAPELSGNKMKTTIRLKKDDGYKCENGIVYYLGYDDIKDDYEYYETFYTAGKICTLGSKENLNDRNRTPDYFLDKNSDGISGNSDLSIRRTTGWRGTTNNTYRHAHGNVKIVKIDNYKNGDVRVTFRYCGVRK